MKRLSFRFSLFFDFIISSVTLAPLLTGPRSRTSRRIRIPWILQRDAGGKPAQGATRGESKLRGSEPAKKKTQSVESMKRTCVTTSAVGVWRETKEKRNNRHRHPNKKKNDTESSRRWKGGTRCKYTCICLTNRKKQPKRRNEWERERGKETV